MSERDTRVETARKVHKELDDFALDFLRAGRETAVLAIRSLMLVHGGALVALLGFIATLASSEAGRTLSVEALVKALSLFAWGAACCVLASIMAYFAYMYRAAHFAELKRVSQSPFFEETQSSRKLDRLVYWTNLASAGFIGASASSLILGIIEVSQALPIVFAASP